MIDSGKKHLHTAGVFIAQDGQEVFGDLRLRGRNTTLHLNLKSELPHKIEPAAIHGALFDRRKVSCLQCILLSAVNGRLGTTEQYHHADLFPHFVTVGRRHLAEDEVSITAVHFSTQDLHLIFDDFQAYGHILASKGAIESLVKGGDYPRSVEFGENPQAFYFSGKYEVVAIETAIGLLRVSHQPTSNIGGGTGIYIKDKLVLTLKFEQPVVLGQCIDRVMSIHRFLSLVAGRKQSIESLSLSLADDPVHQHSPLELYWMHAPKGSTSKAERPHPGDLPVDAVRRSTEFKSVLVSWLKREPAWRTARIRYAGCASKRNSYSVDRLVAAANMFDILPADATPPKSERPAELAKAKQECREIFRRLVPGIERNSILRDLGRMGAPSLTKKVLYHADLVNDKLASRFPDLSQAAVTAVKCRNFFVHGSEDFDYPRFESLTPFLTDVLEFIFAASDLISAGWDAEAWGNRHYSAGHSFTRFRWGYKEHIALLKQALS
jgi:hypothetical protein